MDTIMIRNMVNNYTKSAIMLGIGVFSLLCAVIPCIILKGSASFWLMNLAVVFGLVMMLMRKIYNAKFQNVRKENWYVDTAIMNQIKEEKKSFQLLVVGIRCIAALSIVLGVLPVVIYGSLTAMALFVFMIAIGSFLLLLSAGILGSYNHVLSLCSKKCNSPYKMMSQHRSDEVFPAIYWITVVTVAVLAGFITEKLWVAALFILAGHGICYAIKITTYPQNRA